MVAELLPICLQGLALPAGWVGFGSRLTPSEAQRLNTEEYSSKVYASPTPWEPNSTAALYQKQVEAIEAYMDG